MRLILTSAPATDVAAPAPVVGWQDIQRAVLIASLVFAVSFLTYSRGLPPNADEITNFALTESLAKGPRLDIDQASTVGPFAEEYGSGGHRYSKYAPIQSVLAVPLYLLAQRLPVGAVDTVLLQGHILTALAAGALFLLARRLGYRAGTGLLLALLFAFTTPAWVHAKRFFGEPTITLLLIATLYWAVAARQTGSRRDLALVGLFAGLTVGAKYVNAIFLVPIALFVVLAPLASARRVGRQPIHRPASDSGGGGQAPALPTRADDGIAAGPSPLPPRGRGEGRVRFGSARLPDVMDEVGRRTLWLGLGALAPAALIAAYNFARFGSILESGYARSETFSTPVLEGVAGFLLSPGKSIFIYAPILVLALFWGPAFFRRFRALGVTILAVCALHIAVFGAWWIWWGAWCWGPRFIIPIVPLGVLFLAEGVERALAERSRARLALLAAFAAVGLAIQVLGVAVDHILYLVGLMPLNPRPDTLTLWDPRYSPILGQLQYLKRETLDFAWIVRDGPRLVNVPALAACLLAVAGAAVGLAGLWRRRASLLTAIALVVLVAGIGATTLFALNRYYRADAPQMRELATVLAEAPDSAAIVYLAPDNIVPYLNSHKRHDYAISWSEEPRPLNSRLERLLESILTRPGEILVVSRYPKGVPSSGIEGTIEERAYKTTETTVGDLRVTRFRVGDEAGRAVPLGVRFAEGIELVAAEAQPTRPGDGGALQLTLSWRASAPVDQDYAAFVHVVDATGKLASQHDGTPASGYRPTNSWPAGQIIADHHVVPAPAAGAAGPFTLHVGLYSRADGKRLMLLDAAGNSIADHAEIPLERLVR